jgi:hypothetical protein
MVTTEYKWQYKKILILLGITQIHMSAGENNKTMLPSRSIQYVYCLIGSNNKYTRI